MRGKIDEIHMYILLLVILGMAFWIAACDAERPIAVDEPVMERVARGGTWGNNVEVYFFEHDGDRCYVATRGEQTANLSCDFAER